MSTNYIETNKLIAEFMGAVKGNDTEKVKDVYVNIPVHGMKEITEAAKYMKYHTSYNWLMPVVEKIEGTEQNGVVCVIQGYKSERFGGSYQVSFRGTDSSFYCEDKSESKIEATYGAVIQFIQWFNAQKP